MLSVGLVLEQGDEQGRYVSYMDCVVMEGKVLCRACILYMATLDPDRSTSVAADIHYLEAGPYLRHGSEGGLVTSPTVRDSWSARPGSARLFA